MKKIFSIFAALLLMTSVYPAETNGRSCDDYATEAVIAEIVQWGAMSFEEFHESYDSYYGACIAAGGEQNMLEPAIIE